MNTAFNTLKFKIAFLFSLLIAIAFAVNWQVAARTIHSEKIEDLEQVLNHLLIESRDEYLIVPPTPQSDLRFLHAIPHNVLILKDSEASHVRFRVAAAPYAPEDTEVSASVALSNGMFLSVISDHDKIDAAVARYGAKLAARYLVSLLLILSIGYLLLERYMKPLALLAERARGWKSGDSFELPLDNPPREIDELSRAFSALVHRLETFRIKEKVLFKEMAHELKTPIALMRARLDVFEGSERISKEKIVSELGGDIERLMSELKNVLFFESTDFEDSSPFTIDEVLSEVIAKVDILTRRRHLAIRVDGEGFGLHAPRKLFAKLMTALIENALTYAKEGSTIIVALDPESRSIALTNEKGGEKYLFSSRIGQKMLDRIAREIGIEYRIEEDVERYGIRLFIR
ncbi:MAG: HAMP domain-containing sensor histidine kinase [Sulfuricurvum sp.]|nr:HAMP domain-containing sensor histidine kinase [Sulfuricurvum sp.]